MTLAYSALWLVFVEDEDQFYLVSHDRTTALPLPRDYHGQWAEIAKPEADRMMRRYPGFVPWPPSDGMEAESGERNAHRD